MFKTGTAMRRPVPAPRLLCRISGLPGSSPDGPWTALDRARSEGHRELVKLLRRLSPRHH